MPRLIFGLSLLASLANLVAADGLFIGCTSSYPYNDESLKFASGTYSSGAACATACTGYTYSYKFYNGQCACSNTGPTASNIAAGDEDTCAQTGRIEADIVNTSFDSTACYDAEDFYLGASDFPGLYSVTDPKQCLANCATDHLAVMQAEGSSGWYCGCASSTTATASTCTTNSYFVFNHPADATASGLARRHPREALDSAKRAQQDQCPGKMTACLVPGLEQNDAWECIDTQNDLESCGGCIHGAYNNATASVGVSCLKPGVKLGAATCVAGQCLVSECKDGLKLVNNECVSQAYQ
ncbi:uncharacterized protein L199_003570 [Kwoniella botswanensis]|uniref:uncharacterized protein n=1 Tax=Kwoniella botswanensis TaxID=1268659 RepID=UPI00315CA320